MRIRECVLLWGENAPDPTYKNLYFYECKTPTGKSAAEIAYTFFHELRPFCNGTGIYSVPFPTDSALYAIGETERGFTVEIPTDDGFPEKPLYMIVDTSTTEGVTNYRFAFIQSFVRTGENKIRCTCLFDQWTEHYSELMTEEMAFTRLHQNRIRYTDNTHTTYTKQYNGLNDPIPEGMVQGSQETIPLEMFGATAATDEGVDYFIVPIFLYWRLSTRDLYRYDTDSTSWVKVYLDGIDPMKSAVPVLCTFIGVNRINPATHEVKFLPCARIFVRTTLLPTRSVTPSLTEILLSLGTSNPYIVQAYISTIPPFDCRVSIRSDHVTSVITVLDTEFCELGRFMGDGNQYRIGSDQEATAFIPEKGTFISAALSNSNLFYPGDQKTLALTSNVVPVADWSDYYEPKIEEAAFEKLTLRLFGAEIDISPTPAIPSVGIIYTLGQHNDLILVSGGKEVYRASGICSQFGVDTATDSLSSWLVSNYNTYQNAKLWKGIGAGTSFGLSLLSSIITGNFLPLVGATTTLGMSVGGMAGSETAMKKDYQNSPNVTTLPSENAVDNMPYLDLPTIRKRVIDSAIKGRITLYWHRFGYPANFIGPVGLTGLNRNDFNFIQGTFLRMLPGIYPAEITDVVSAFGSGVWVWMSHLSESAGNPRYTERNEIGFDCENQELHL